MMQGRTREALTLVIGQEHMPPEEDETEGALTDTADAESPHTGRDLCSNGCGRPSAEGYPSCCRTCLSSHGKHHGPWCERNWKQADGHQVRSEGTPAPDVTATSWSLLRNWCPPAQAPLWLRTPFISGENYRIAHPIPKAWEALWNQGIPNQLERLRGETAGWLDKIASVSGWGWRQVRPPPQGGMRRNAPRRQDGEGGNETVFYHPKHLLIYFADGNEVCRILFLVQGPPSLAARAGEAEEKEDAEAPPPGGSALREDTPEPRRDTDSPRTEDARSEAAPPPRGSIPGGSTPESREVTEPPRSNGSSAGGTPRPASVDPYPPDTPGDNPWRDIR